MGNLGQSASDSELGTVDQVRMAQIDGIVIPFQRYSLPPIGSGRQGGSDWEAAIRISRPIPKWVQGNRATNGRVPASCRSLADQQVIPFHIRHVVGRQDEAKSSSEEIDERRDFDRSVHARNASTIGRRFIRAVG